jgi:hypothetical protein
MLAVIAAISIPPFVPPEAGTIASDRSEKKGL